MAVKIKKNDVGNNERILEWKSKGLSDEIVKAPSTPNILGHLLAYNFAKKFCYVKINLNLFMQQ